jgi:uncharacterized protein
MSGGTAKDVASIVSAAGTIVGRTRLQKTVSLLELVGLGYGFSFEYYKFGPFSDELVVSLDRAVDLDYVQEEERRANWGGRYSIFMTAQSHPTDNPGRDALIVLARDADAIALELAVTAAFLASEGSADAWREVAERKPEKAGAQNLTAAKKLYAKFLGVQVPRPLPVIS